MGLQVWRGRVSGNHLDEVTVLAKLMEMQIWLLPVYTHRKGRGLNKDKWTLPALLSGR